MIIDAFAGGGGASVGIEMALGRPLLIARATARRREASRESRGFGSCLGLYINTRDRFSLM